MVGILYDIVGMQLEMGYTMLYPSGGNVGNEDFKVIGDLKMDGLRCVWGLWVRKPQKNAGTKQ